MARTSSKLPSFLYLLLILSSKATSQPEFQDYYCFDHFFGYSKYTQNSTYDTNLNTLLSNLTSYKQTGYGFYNLSYGEYPDTVFAMGLCRGDVMTDVCHGCLKNATILPHKCPYVKQAVGIYDECLLQYSDKSVFGTEGSLSIILYMPSQNSTINWDQYYEVLTNLLGNLSTRAASGDSMLKFAAGNEEGPSFQTIYALVQCRPDFNESECNNCLVDAISKIPNCCNGKLGGGVIKPSCIIRYESYRFYEITADVPLSAPSLQVSPPSSPLSSSPTSTTNTTSPKGKSKTSRTIIAIAVAFLGFVLVFIVVWIHLRARTRKRRESFQSEAEADNADEFTESSLKFEFNTIKVATNNFSDENKLGQGGFGLVYKGRLSDEQKIAVKRLSRDSGQGDTEFKNEVLLLTKLQHRNLVKLLGFSLKQKERLLIYEFIPNKSLDHFIFDPIRHAQLEWKTRYKIIEGIVKGLLYLHEESQQRIIHRDLKASNILLDAEMNPKISDFGMAKLFVVDQTQANTNRIVGTLGYMAPEYARHGQFSVKSDVFSFGVIILEIVTGKKNGGFHNGGNVEHLPSFAWKSWRKGTASDIIDPSLKDGSRNEIMRCIHIGLLCVQEKAADRPTLASIMLMLSSHSFCLPLPLQPAFFMSNRSISGKQSGEYSSLSKKCPTIQQSNSAEISSIYEATITDLHPR